jgi:sporadic carbohydrate cluster protein (TIGR04323 family)
MTARSGYRGYIVSRPVRGTAFPQRVQNLVVRDFARRRGLPFKLSVTEYAMPNCSMMLEQLLGEIGTLEGVILFSAFTLPGGRAQRAAMVTRILDAGAVLYAALEDLTVRDAAGQAELEALLAVASTLPATPFGGRYEKSDEPLRLDRAGRELLTACSPWPSPSPARPPILQG